jgi:hypothetical protein
MESQGLPPEMSNFYCLPGRPGDLPFLLGFQIAYAIN